MASRGALTLKADDDALRAIDVAWRDVIYAPLILPLHHGATDLLRLAKRGDIDAKGRMVGYAVLETANSIVASARRVWEGARSQDVPKLQGVTREAHRAFLAAAVGAALGVLLRAAAKSVGGARSAGAGWLQGASRPPETVVKREQLVRHLLEIGEIDAVTVNGTARPGSAAEHSATTSDMVPLDAFVDSSASLLSSLLAVGGSTAARIRQCMTALQCALQHLGNTKCVDALRARCSGPAKFQPSWLNV